MKLHITCFLVCMCMQMLNSQAQLPPNQPQQDCIHAIPVCEAVIYEPASYVGRGLNSSEIDSVSSCLDRGERNGAWYLIHTLSAGDICFTITPDSSLQDIDFTVFNLTNATCADLKNDSTLGLEVACNFITNIGPCNGITGADGQTSGLCGFMHTPCISASSGETYLLYVSNYNVFAEGYTIDFSASTALLFDNNSVQAEASVNMPATNKIQLTFNKPVACSDISLSSLNLQGATTNYVIDSITSDDCKAGSDYDVSYYLYVQPSLDLNDLGDMFVQVNDTIHEMCGTTMINQQIPIQLNFDILRSPQADTLCANEEVLLSSDIPSSSGLVLVWMPGQDTTYNLVVRPSSDVTYQLQVFSSKGDLIGQQSEEIIVRPSPQVSIGNDTTLCNVDTLSLRVAGGFSNYQWSNDDEDSVTLASQSGLYWVEVQNGEGCLGRDSIDVLFSDVPDATFDVQGMGQNLTFSSICTDCNSFLWEFGDGNSSVDPEPTHFFASPGQYFITLVVINDCGSDTLTSPLMVGPSSVNSLNEEGYFQLYPNPASSQLFLVSSIPTPGSSSILIHDTFGKSVWAGEIASQELKRIPLNGFPEGIYVCEIRTEEGRFTMKFIVTR